MAGAGGLLLVLIGGLIALVLSVGTVFAAVYALVAKDAQRGFKLGVAAIVTSGIAVVLSSPFWIVVLRGKDTHGEALRYPESWPILALVLFEGALLATAVAGTLRQRSRH